MTFYIPNAAILTPLNNKKSNDLDNNATFLSFKNSVLALLKNISNADTVTGSWE